MLAGEVVDLEVSGQRRVSLADLLGPTRVFLAKDLAVLGDHSRLLELLV